MPDIAESKKIIFAGSTGDKLAARLDLPFREPIAYALFAHCFTCSKDNLAAFRISKALTQHGIAVLRFDFTGLGNSEGDFSNTNFSSNIQDLIQAADFLRDNYQAPQILIGHSLGGAAILAASENIAEVKALVTIAAPADVAHVKNILADDINDIKSKGDTTIAIAGRKFHIKKQFLDDLDEHHLTDVVSTIDKSLLFFHSPADAIVNIENAYTLFAAAKSPKSFIALEGADHLLSRKEDSAYVANVLAAWVMPYLTPHDQVMDASSQVIVTGTKESHYTQDISADNHVFYADEPIAIGGNDLGPGPYDYLLAALGACKAITLRMYADNKNLPLDRTVIKLNHKKDYAKDCKDCEKTSAKIDKIAVAIELQGDLTQEQREKLLAISEKCPVHKTLTSTVEIESTLTEKS